MHKIPCIDPVDQFTVGTVRPGSGRSPFKTLALVQSIMVAGVVHAQTTAPAPSSNPADGTTSERLPDVVVEESAAPKVSSPKYTEPLRDVPQTITVIGRQVIEQQGATTLREVLRNTPGITFQAGEGGTPTGDQMTIRGFSARTDMFIDGFRDTGGYSRDAFNLEQVEVTKGPSSSVSGRGSTGGSINLVSKTPKAEPSQTASAGVGTDDYKRATLDVNQPLPDGAIKGAAIRVNALWQDSGVPGRDVVENKSWAVAPSFALGLGTATRATISHLHLEQDNIPDYGLPWVPAANTPTALASFVNQAPPIEFSNFYGLKARDYEKIDNDISTLQLERDLGSAFTLRNISRYGRTQRDSIVTSPRFTGSAATTDIRRNDWKSRDQVDDIVGNQTNLSGSFPTGPLTHAVSTGLEISRETSKNYTRVATGPNSPSTDLYRPNPNDPYTEAIARNGAYTKATADSVSLYAFDTVKLGEHWQLNGGARWDRFETDHTATTRTPAKLSRSDEMLSWKAGAVFKPRENASIYAAYGTSFNPSAEGLALAANTVNLEPEKTRNYEIGAKWDLERRLSLSAALFRTEKTNARTPGINAGDPPTVLQGGQRVEGVELGVSGNLTPHWTAFAGYAYMKSTIERSNTAADVDNDLTLTPESTFNAWTNYEFPGGFSLGAGAQFMDAVFRNTANTTSVPSYWIYNATAAYEVNQHLTLRLNVNNLSDEKYVDRVGGGHFVPGAARSAVLTATFKL